MLTWLLRLEDPRHIWVKHEGSPVVMRLRLVDSLTVPQMRHMSIADCAQPMQVDVDIGAWSNDAFWATLLEIHCIRVPERDERPKRPKCTHKAPKSPRSI